MGDPIGRLRADSRAERSSALDELSVNERSEVLTRLLTSHPELPQRRAPTPNRVTTLGQASGLERHDEPDRSMDPADEPAALVDAGLFTGALGVTENDVAADGDLLERCSDLGPLELSGPSSTRPPGRLEY